MKDQYILGNKEAWEEAFDNREESWGSDIVERVQKEEYAFFNGDTVKALKKYDLKDKAIGQFCCNNGRELLSLVRTTGAKEGIGFDIAENQVRFANEKAEELHVPCHFVAKNILEIGDAYKEKFDFVLITIGALCWFKDLKEFFQVIANCMKPGAAILINEQHPMTNIIATSDEEEYNENYPLNCCHSYFEKEWVGNEGMYYMTKKQYESKSFTDYTHCISDIIGSMCANGILITDMQEFDYDIAGMFDELEGKAYPLSMILEGKKEVR